jgi:hypothetical protein
MRSELRAAKTEERVHLGDLNVDERVILKLSPLPPPRRILNKMTTFK